MKHRVVTAPPVAPPHREIGARERGAGLSIGPRRHFSLSLSLPLALVLVLLVAGCGRKATREDCETVVDRNVELQLKALGVTDPAIVGKRRGEMRASMEKDIQECVGKRVTDSMMVCVKTADTAEQIDKCLK